MSTNLLIVDEKIEKTEDMTTFDYGIGASGVIFKREGDTYYALTANHVVNTGRNYKILHYGAPKVKMPIKDFFAPFPSNFAITYFPLFFI